MGGWKDDDGVDDANSNNAFHSYSTLANKEICRSFLEKKSFFFEISITAARYIYSKRQKNKKKFTSRTHSMSSNYADLSLYQIESRANGSMTLFAFFFSFLFIFYFSFNTQTIHYYNIRHDTMIIFDILAYFSTST